MKRLFAVLFLLMPVICHPSSGLAQSVATTDLSQSIGTTAVTIPAWSPRKTLSIGNDSSTAVVGYKICVTAANANCATAQAAIGASGTQSLQPGQVAFWPLGTAPAEAISIVASAGSTPVTIYEGR